MTARAYVPPKDVDPVRLRELWNLMPRRPLWWIAAQLGVCVDTLYDRARKEGLPLRGQITREAKGIPLEAPRERGPRIRQTRCAACGGRRQADTPHECREAEPLAFGLRVTRAAAEVSR